MRSSLATFLLLFLLFNNAFSQSIGEKEEVTNALQAFQHAIVQNNIEAASKLLSGEARILEGGNIQTKEKYLSHHFHADGKFLSAMEREIKSRAIFIEGNVAWVTTKSRVHGTYSGRPIDVTSLELAVLKKADDQWKIVVLQWSSSPWD